MIISIIAGMDKNRLIGQGNQLPWRLPADMQHFRRHTLGKPVLMGRKTFESIGKPLPKRTNIILTHDLDYRADGCVVTHSIEEALDTASGCEEIMIIGGASIYTLFLPRANRLYLTYVHGCFEGDVYFPVFDLTDWQEVKRVDCQPDEKTRIHIVFSSCTEGAKMPNNRLKLCMLSGSFEYDSETSLAVFQDYIEKNHPVEATQIIYQSEDDDQSLESLQDTDVLLVFTRRLNTTGKELDRFKAYCDEGKPIVGVRTASHAYQNWIDFDKEVLGGDYQGHYGAGPIAHAEIDPNVKGHPILQGISNFDSYGSLYKNSSIATDTTLLLTGKTEEHTEPVAWTRIHHGGRICYTSLGHQRDFEVEMFLRLLANGVLWAGGRLDTI